MEKTKDFRLGHRDRVRARFLREGLSAFADYEVLELLLFYAIPRRDTKGQAHALDDTIGSLYEALTADADALYRVKGIGERTAAFLRSLYPFLEYVAKGEPHGDVCRDDKSLAVNIFPYLDRSQGETATIVFLNNRDNVIYAKQLGAGKSLLLTDLKGIMADAYFYGAPSVVLADYKAEGIPFPDGMIVQGLHSMKEELYRVGIRLRDYMMFTDSQYNSLFLLTGQRAFESPSPFFIYPSLIETPTYCNDSMRHLVDILSFVSREEKAKAIAERLLTKYRTIENILSLPYTTLVTEDESWTGEMLFLKILSEVYARAELSRVRKRKGKYANAREIGEMFSSIIGTYSEEIVALAMFDKDMNLIDVFFCNKGAVNSTAFAMRTMAEVAVGARAAYVAIAHNHPSGVTEPSMADIAMTTGLQMSFSQANIAFIDHFVVTASDYLAISRSHEKQYSCMPDEFFEK